jgi:L-threonylcarbamoyladenylate synthase
MILSAQHKTLLSVFEKKFIQMLLEDDQIIAFPTDTVYGLGVNAKSSKAVNKLYEIKKRNQNKAFILMLDTLDKVRTYIADANLADTPILKKYWPGPLSVIFEAKPGVSIFYSRASCETIGIRIPNQVLLLDLLAFLPFPIASTSANISDEQPLTNALSIEQTFNQKSKKQQIACIIDGGSLIGAPSTVVQLNSNSAKLLRNGSIDISDEALP